MKRFLISLAVVLVVAAAVAPVSSGAIRITKISYDSPGSDRGSNSSLNAEWIRIKNTGSSAKALTGWTIRDVASHVYRLGTLRLAAGASMTVHTGSGSNSASHRYWESGWYIWNNDGDTARLKNRSGTTVDSCSYSGSGSTTAC